MTQRAGQPDLERFSQDLRVFDANGIERAAWGWDQHEARRLDEYRKAERAALAQIEKHDLGPLWEEVRRTLFGLTETAGALVTWKAQHGERGHKAERAAFGAALGLVAKPHLTAEQYADLVAPMSEAVPWLLPGRKPAPREPKP
jgi:hypothetical protein